MRCTTTPPLAAYGTVEERSRTLAHRGVLSPTSVPSAPGRGVNRIDVEVTEELVAGLARIVLAWPPMGSGTPTEWE
jgi:hypothetical protein